MVVEMINTLQSIRVVEQFIWIPVHIGVGDETADKQAAEKREAEVKLR